MKTKMKKLKMEMRSKERELRDHITAMFPRGTRVSIKLGGHVVVGVVDCMAIMGHEVLMTNEKTGKQRRFDPTYTDWDYA